MKSSRWLVFAGMGFESLVLVLGGIWLGGEADKKMSLGGFGVVLGAFAGIGLWFFHLVKTLNALSKKDD